MSGTSDATIPAVAVVRMGARAITGMNAMPGRSAGATALPKGGLGTVVTPAGTSIGVEIADVIADLPPEAKEPRARPPAAHVFERAIGKAEIKGRLLAGKEGRAARCAPRVAGFVILVDHGRYPSMPVG